MICLPGGRGRDAAHGLTGGTVSWRVPCAGETPAAAGCLPSPRSTRPPGHRAALPGPPLDLRGFALESVAAAAPCWQRWASRAHSDHHRAAAFFLARRSCFANRRGNDALRERLRLQISSRARAAAGWKSGVKWNLFDSRPLFHLTPLPPAARGRLSVLAKAKPVDHGSGPAFCFCSKGLNTIRTPT